MPDEPPPSAKPQAASSGTTVSFADCRRELLDRANAGGIGAYQAWRRRPGYADVVQFVESFTHEFLFRLTRADLEAVFERTEHALGDVCAEEQLRIVEDFTCPFAFQHLFHRYLEEQQALPTWQELFGWLRGPGAPYYLQPLLRHVQWHSADERERMALRRAMRWRLGKFYYSALREIELLVRLREECGLPVRYHLLADVLLRVDFWLENVLVCTYVPNGAYRSGTNGRKPPAERFLGGNGFQILQLPVRHQGFGTLWRVSDASLQEVAERVRQSVADG